MLPIEPTFRLNQDVSDRLRERPVPWGFPVLSHVVYLRTYSRLREDGKQETWADTVIRVVEGVMSIRKHWYRLMGLRWDERAMQELAGRMALAIYDMEFLPPGRGLWAMGTQTVYEKGGMALNNCCFVSVTDSLAEAAAFLMDALMLGVGVGFDTHRVGRILVQDPRVNGEPVTYVIPDSREGWVESVRRLIRSYEIPGQRPVHFDYDQIRPAGSPIRGFGGVASGPEPLRELHERLRTYLDRAIGRPVDTRLIADVMNAIGCCVVAGNVRRSAEIALGSSQDMVFRHLKNYALYPERAEIGWMSNNSIVLEHRDDFSVIPEVVDRIIENGEPGFVNLLNVRKYGRAGEKLPDQAIGVNPCGEIPLESHELCNLVEIFPTRCGDRFFEICRLATFYASTVSLLLTHVPETNAVLSRNRRIGVSVSGVADWVEQVGPVTVFGLLNQAYDLVRQENRRWNLEAGIPPAIRVTTVKPSGTVSLLAGVSPGMHYPEGGYVLRRVRISERSQLTERLVKAGIRHEPDHYSKGTLVFEFPVSYGQGQTRSVRNVSIWEQAAVLVMLQRAWADNAVSNTLKFQPDEAGEIARVLAFTLPQVKTVSLLPDVDEGAYPQMPLERISRDEFERRMAEMRQVDWDGLAEDSGGSRYCDGEACEL